MVERFIAPVLKTGDPKGSVGSNPTPSAKRKFHHKADFLRRPASLYYGGTSLPIYVGQGHKVLKEEKIPEQSFTDLLRLLCVSVAKLRSFVSLVPLTDVAKGGDGAKCTL
jgi:hypothetical protein